MSSLQFIVVVLFMQLVTVAAVGAMIIVHRIFSIDKSHLPAASVKVDGKEIKFHYHSFRGLSFSFGVDPASNSAVAFFARRSSKMIEADDAYAQTLPAILFYKNMQVEFAATKKQVEGGPMDGVDIYRGSFSNGTIVGNIFVEILPFNRPRRKRSRRRTLGLLRGLMPAS